MISVFVLILVGCEYDNYDPPRSFLTGTVTYNGNPVGVRSGATQLELWQHGYQLFEKIPVYIAQDGTFLQGYMTVITFWFALKELHGKLQLIVFL